MSFGLDLSHRVVQFTESVKNLFGGLHGSTVDKAVELSVKVHGRRVERKEKKKKFILNFSFLFFILCEKSGQRGRRKIAKGDGRIKVRHSIYIFPLLFENWNSHKYQKFSSGSTWRLRKRCGAWKRRLRASTWLWSLSRSE